MGCIGFRETPKHKIASKTPRTPLALAAKEGHMEASRLLLRARAAPRLNRDSATLRPNEP